MEKLAPTEEMMSDEKDSIDEIRDSLMEVLNKVGGYRGDIKRQEEVIRNLPDDLIFRLEGHIRAIYVDDEKYGGIYRGKRTHELNDSERRNYEMTVLRGELFEQLIQCDTELVKETSKEGDELLGLLENPERYRLEDEMGSIRNPDLAYIEINDEGRIIIKGVGEAKLGYLRFSALHQMEKFESSTSLLESTINKLEQPEKLKEHGLEGLAGRKKQMEQVEEEGPLISISNDFKKTLILPSNRGIDKGNLYENIFSKSEKSNRNRKRFNEVFKNVEIKKAAFSVNDVVEMANYIYEHLMDAE